MRTNHRPSVESGKHYTVRGRDTEAGRWAGNEAASLYIFGWHKNDLFRYDCHPLRGTGLLVGSAKGSHLSARVIEIYPVLVHYFLSPHGGYCTSFGLVSPLRPSAIVATIEHPPTPFSSIGSMQWFCFLLYADWAVSILAHFRTPATLNEYLLRDLLVRG